MEFFALIPAWLSTLGTAVASGGAVLLVMSRRLSRERTALRSDAAERGLISRLERTLDEQAQRHQDEMQALHERFGDELEQMRAERDLAVTHANAERDDALAKLDAMREQAWAARKDLPTNFGKL